MHTTQPRNLGRALALSIQRCGLTQSLIADAIGSQQSVIARYVAGNRRPHPTALDQLTHLPVWQGSHSGIQIMIGHLHDEMERAGWSHQSVMMRPRGEHRRPLRSLREIEDAIMSGDDDVAGLIEHIADMLRRARTTAEAAPIMKVAEPSSSYTTTKKARKPLSN
jgi:hypothetical protein